MTIAIAALAQEAGRHMVILTTDRMFTVGDMEYEPKGEIFSPKLFNLTSHIAGAIAGDIPAQTTIIQASQIDVQSKGITTVQDAAKIFANHFAEFRRRDAETKYLFPLGLSLESFVDKAKGLPIDTVEAVRQTLQNHRLSLSAIIAGIEPNGWSHIYLVLDPGVVHCQDAVGFAVIGSGARHASSHFMVHGYHPDAEIWEGLLISYTAKRRAEAAPYVGYNTDMGVITLANGSQKMTSPLMKHLENAYIRSLRAERTAWKREQQRLVEGVKKLTIQSASQSEPDSNAP